MVSVIIPCYNQSHFLPEAVESVVNQTCISWEIIIVDDGSTDDTLEVANQLATKYRRHQIRVIHQENQGLAQSRNNGIALSSKKYIIPLDADDKLHPDFIQVTIAELQSNSSVHIVYTDLIQFGIADRVVHAREWDPKVLPNENLLSYCSPYRREVWETVGGYNSNLIWGYEDWDFWVGCCACGFVGKRIGMPLFLYRVKETSMYTEAVKHDEWLRARIILNHPSVYTPQDIERARSVINAQ